MLRKQSNRVHSCSVMAVHMECSVWYWECIYSRSVLIGSGSAYRSVLLVVGVHTGMFCLVVGVHPGIACLVLMVVGAQR